MDKEKNYKKVLEALEALMGEDEGEYRLDDIGKMAIISTVVKRAFPHLLFVGFYRVAKPGLLTVGPYQGDIIACGTIPFGRGACGICAERGETVIVDDVSQFPGYIACDEQTKSEIVVPVIQDSEVTAVFDLDSDEIGGFNKVDELHLVSIVGRFLE